MTLIQTAKLNGVEPMAWFSDVLERIVSGRIKAHKLHTVLPWLGASRSGLRQTSPTPPWQRHNRMIDHRDQVERLMRRLSAALPIPARMTPEMQTTLRQQRGMAMPAT
jgi:hypothetical protein